MPAHRTLRLMMIVAGVWLAGTAPMRGQGPDCPPWEQKHPAVAPSPRHSHAMAYDGKHGVTVLFGGVGDGILGDTWEWNGVEWTQLPVAGPQPRTQHAMAYDEARGVVVLFGGGSGGYYFNDTWEWNGSQWSLRSTTGPSARVDARMAYDSLRGVTVLFGGQVWGHSIVFDDTWEWDGDAWRRRDSPGPSRRLRHAMVYDAQRGATLLFGGVTWDGYSQNDTWAWNGEAWSLLNPSSPAVGSAGVMVYDRRQKTVLLLPDRARTGGSPSTWQWNGQNWELRSLTSPGQRLYFAMSFDEARGATVLFGGYSDVVFGDTETWELPTCGDSDDDGVPDPDDACDFSDLRSNIVIDGCDSGVGNHLFDDGCTMADQIAACAEEPGNHGAFVGCVGELTKTWMRDEFISSRDKGPIQRCAAQADLPQRNAWRVRPTKGRLISPVKELSRP